jgi:hypothetical protein
LWFGGFGWFFLFWHKFHLTQHQKKGWGYWNLSKSHLDAFHPAWRNSVPSKPTSRFILACPL